MANTALNRSSVLLLTNKSGGDVAQGDVVVMSTGTAAAFTTNTAGAYVSGPIGVVIEPNGIADNAIGLVVFQGYVPKITLSGAASLGDLFKSHTVAKQAVRHAAPEVAGDFGEVLGTGTTPAALLWGNPVQAGGGAGSDTTAIHDNVASEISAITEKATPIDADMLVIEDSADGNNKKMIQIGNLPAAAAGAMTLIDDVTVGVGGAANYDKSSIAGTYKHLKLIWDARGDTAATTTGMRMTLNNDSGANYSAQYFQTAGASTTPGNEIDQTNVGVGSISAANAAAGDSGSGELMIANYAGTTFRKRFTAFAGFAAADTANNQFEIITSGKWKSTSAITRITLIPSAGNFVQGSRFSLYGIS